MSPRHLALLLMLFAFAPLPAVAADTLEVELAGEGLTVTRYAAQGELLFLWVAPGYGGHSRMQPVAEQLAAAGVEVWHVDLADSLFLPKSTTTLRALDGRYVDGLIEQAHQRTGKTIVLVSRSYGALPVLRGARRWQARTGSDYLAGAILFSPELYSEIPALGLPPVFDPVVDATNIPLMLYQGGSRNNRWQFAELVERLQGGGARVFVKVMPEVTGLFYEEDTDPATLRIHAHIGPHMQRMANLLRAAPTPAQALPLAETRPPAQAGLDTELRRFRGNPLPPPLDLHDAEGRRVRHADYRGQVTVVNFWATWCGPCVEEIPALNRLRERMVGKPFELVSVDFMEDRQRVEAFLQRVEVTFPVLMDSDGQVSARWGVLVFPSTFVIGPDGRVVYGVNGALHWDSDEVVSALTALLPAP